MAKSLKLLLIENVDSLGIVGDVVNVRTGYARNYLLPRSLATQPSEEKVKELAGRRAQAQKEVEAQRSQRVALNDKLKGVELTLTRSCNDQGILYGAITQQDIATALKENGHIVHPRDVRITQTIKRVDNFDIHIKLDADLDQMIKLHVKADRELPKTKVEEAEAAAAAAAGDAPGGGHAGAGGGERRRRDQWMLPDESARVVGWGSGKKDEASDAAKSEKKAKAKADKAEKAEKAAKAETGDEPKAEKAEKPAKAEKADKPEKKAAKKKD